ncbi:transcriptional regulator [Spirochaetia bacterium]|nr:transcriptional regulator [Spirochaetia bacterium]
MKNCKLVAGEKGLDRLVTWPYYSELIEFGSWLTGGELIIFSGISLVEPRQHLERLVSECIRVSASGLLVFVHENHISKIDPDILVLCDKLSLPLFEVPWETKVIHLTKQISQFVMSRQLSATASYNILRDLLLNNTAQPEILREFNKENETYQIVYMGIKNLEIYFKENKILHESDIGSFKLYMLRNAEKWFEAKQYPVKLSFIDTAVVLFIPVQYHGKAPAFSAFIGHMQKFNGLLSYFIGLSRQSQDIHLIRDKYLEARRAAEFAQARELPVCSYAELGFSHLLFHFSNKKILEEYYEDILSALTCYTRENNSDLLDTLICYLRSDCNLNIAAKELFIHENTLRYRLKRIEEVLSLNLKSYTAITELNNAIKIGAFLGKFETGSI